GHAAGDLERHFRRVDRVLLAVDQLDPHVDDRVSVHAAVHHRLVDALLHRGDVTAGDRATDDLVDELEPAAPRQRLDVDHAHTELAVAAGLLLVLALDVLRTAGDRLAVRHAHVFGVDIDTELARQLLQRDLQV